MKETNIYTKKLIKNLSIFILYFIYGIIPTLILYSLNINTNNWNNNIKSIYLITINLIYLIFILFVYKKELKKDFDNIKDNYFKTLSKYILLYILGVFLMSFSSTLISKITGSVISNNEISVRNYIKLYPIYMCFSTIVFAPIVEEITFRKTFRNIINNKYLFIIISGTIFGLVHITSPSSINDFLMIIPYIIMGIDFSYIYYKSNSIFTTISFHCLHNLILFLIQIIGGLS